MKRIFLPLVLIALTLVSCDEEVDPRTKYLGSWLGTNIEITDCDNFEDEDFRTLRCNETSCNRLIFKDDGTYSFQRGLVIENGTWTVEGINITFCVEEDEGDICSMASGSLTSVLRLTYEPQENSCVTAYVFSKEEAADEDSGN